MGRDASSCALTSWAKHFTSEHTVDRAVPVRDAKSRLTRGQVIPQMIQFFWQCEQVRRCAESS